MTAGPSVGATCQNEELSFPTTPTPTFSDGHILVKYASQPSSGRQSVSGLAVERVKPNETVAEALVRMESIPAVLYAEPDYLAFPLSKEDALQHPGIPSDPVYPEQWHLAAINAPAAWAITTGSPAVQLCFIDSGIASNHPDLSSNIPFNNSADDSSETGFNSILVFSGAAEDDFGHGTHCAVIAVAVGDNNMGGAGVAWHSSILACKFMNATGAGKLSDALRCMDWCSQQGASVVSISWGTPAASRALRDGMSALSEQSDALFVVAAGNDCTDNSKEGATYPAGFNLPGQINVAATVREGGLAKFSNWGPETTHIAAPGVSILSTSSDGGYGTRSGTSSSAPMVVGALAVMKAASQGELPNTLLRSMLLDSAKKDPLLEATVANGAFLDVGAAVKAAWTAVQHNNDSASIYDPLFPFPLSPEPTAHGLDIAKPLPNSPPPRPKPRKRMPRPPWPRRRRRPPPVPKRKIKYRKPPPPRKRKRKPDKKKKG